MVYVAFVCRKHRCGVEFASDHDDDGVKNRKCYEEKYGNGVYVLGRLDGEYRDDEAYGQRAAVTHKDLCRVPVVEHKRQQCGGERSRECHHELVAVAVAYAEERTEYNKADQPRKSIEPVNEVKGVGIPDSGENGKGDGKPPQCYIHAVECAERGDHNAVHCHKERGDGDGDELGVGHGVPVVVENSDNKNDQQRHAGQHMGVCECKIKTEYGKGDGEVDADPRPPGSVVHMYAS